MGKYRIIGKKGWKWQKKKFQRKSTKSNRFFAKQSISEAHNQTNFPGTVRTARNRIKKNFELRNKVAAKKPFLTDMNKEQKMGFALEYLPQGMNFWEKVVFTDEKTFVLL